MSRITIKPAWVLRSGTGDHFEPQLFRLLHAIHDTGKLTNAAKTVGLSYRHSWQLLSRWASIFGSPLVTMEQGRGTRLTPLGEKLLWVEQRTEASLFPQLENIASELNVEIGRAQRHTTPVIRVHASHGYAIEKIPELLRAHGHVDVDLKYVGSVEALASLHRGSCDLAGFHVPLGDMAPVCWTQYARWVQPRQQRVVRMVIRTQGLIVPRGNPLKIHSLADLLKPRIKFVNRQVGSGTRVLLDGLLKTHGIDAKRIQGYDTGEFTHAAVAAYVASGMADVGIGIEPAARQFKLDFIPIVKERYMLACKTQTLASASVKELLDLLKGPSFSEMIDPVPGYELDSPGDVITFPELFPWLVKTRPSAADGRQHADAQSEA